MSEVCYCSLVAVVVFLLLKQKNDMAHDGVNKGLRPGTLVAKQAFLYEGVTNTKELAELADVHINTIKAHMPAWLKERQEIVSNSSESSLALVLSEQTLNEHKKHIAFFESNLTKMIHEHETVEEIVSNLENICDNFALNTDNGDKALNLLDKYLRLSMNKRNLMSQIVSVKKLWDEKVGVDSLMEVQVTREKALATGRAKLQLKNEGGEDMPSNIEEKKDGFFVRRGVEV